MPPSPPSLEPDELQTNTEPQYRGEDAAADVTNADAPLSFVPHMAEGVPAPKVTVLAGRYGELETHELIRLLDTIEDERARGRFRESIYISVFVWIVIAWFVMYGPRFLWHAPKLISPVDILKQRELTTLTNPTLAPNIATAPVKRAPAPRPTVDNRTLEHLREMAPKPAPRVAAATPPPPPMPHPAVSNAVPNLPSAPQPQPVSPRTPPPVLADAPTPQPSSRSPFANGSSARSNIENAVNAAARGGRGGDIPSPRGGGKALGGGVEVLSDTQGVDFDAYVRRVHDDLLRNWLPLLPEETQPPLSKQGETWIRFTILPDGRIGEMHLDGSTHDEAINRSCWGSITSEGQFRPLPPAFHGPNLELRFHYMVNKQGD